MRQHHKHVVKIVLVLAICLTVFGCATTVTHNGKPVTDEVVVNAARAVYAADELAAQVAGFLMAGYEAGVIPRDLMTRYANEIGPMVQDGIEKAAQAVVAIDAMPTEENQDALESALARLHVVLRAAISFVRPYGFGEETQ